MVEKVKRDVMIQWHLSHYKEAELWKSIYGFVKGINYFRMLITFRFKIDDKITNKRPKRNIF